MKTIKPISTISYNSKNFLVLKLNELLKAHKISFWCFIFHKAEVDEKKDHFHLYIEPNTRLDTMDLQDELKEIVIGSDKPLGCINFHSSKFADWYYYSMHYKPYLAGKNESRQYSYCRADFVCCDDDCLDDLIVSNPCPYDDLIKAYDLISQGYSDIDIAKFFHVPMYRLEYFVKGIQLMRTAQLERYQGVTHE